jgi:hypothetical protein
MMIEGESGPPVAENSGARVIIGGDSRGIGAGVIVPNEPGFLSAHDFSEFSELTEGGLNARQEAAACDPPA